MARPTTWPGFDWRHDVKLIAPETVRPFVKKGQKNDAADAAAICEAGLRPGVKFVPITAYEDGLWGRRYPAIAQSWRRAWSEVIPFYAFPDQVRRILYTTNDIDKRSANFPAIIVRHGRPRDEERRRDVSAAALSFMVASHLWRPCTV